MCNLPKITITTECPITKLGPVSISIYYAINKDGVAVGRAERCRDSKDGVITCHKCLAYFSMYPSYFPLPKDGDFIPADLDRFLAEKQQYQEYIQDS